MANSFDLSLLSNSLPMMSGSWWNRVLLPLHILLNRSNEGKVKYIKISNQLLIQISCPLSCSLRKENVADHCSCPAKIGIDDARWSTKEDCEKDAQVVLSYGLRVCWQARICWHVEATNLQKICCGVSILKKWIEWHILFHSRIGNSKLRIFNKHFQNFAKDKVHCNNPDCDYQHYDCRKCWQDKFLTLFLWEGVNFETNIGVLRYAKKIFITDKSQTYLSLYYPKILVIQKFG